MQKTQQKRYDQTLILDHDGRQGLSRDGSFLATTRPHKSSSGAVHSQEPPCELQSNCAKNQPKRLPWIWHHSQATAKGPLAHHHSANTLLCFALPCPLMPSSVFIDGTLMLAWYLFTSMAIINARWWRLHLVRFFSIKYIISQSSHSQPYLATKHHFMFWTKAINNIMGLWNKRYRTFYSTIKLLVCIHKTGHDMVE